MTTAAAQAAAPLVASSPLLDARDLQVRFAVGGDRSITPVDGVSLRIQAGETLGLVGESGCGKSTLGRGLLQLVRPTAGTVRFLGAELTALAGEPLRTMRRHIQMIFQDPRGSLDPRMRVRDIVEEPLRVHNLAQPPARRRAARAMLEQVGIAATYDLQRPTQMSGGQQQRVAIARALITQPKLIVCDEPVSALDVSIQAQVLNLLRELKDRFGVAYLFITHNLAVARTVSDRVAVMYLGRIVEEAPARVLFARPLHPYTHGLMGSALGIDRGARARLTQAQRLVTGDVPSLLHPPAGCRFHPRCPHAQERCKVDAPALERADDDRLVACHFWKDIGDKVWLPADRGLRA
jgi:oligopeptide/dipeptide ABC transporter ATP-binding protein